MGVFRNFRDWISGKTDAERIESMADDVMRYADRYENADQDEDAAVARDFAGQIRMAPTLDSAKDLFEKFEDYVDLHEVHEHHDFRQRDDHRTENENDSSGLSDDS